MKKKYIIIGFIIIVIIATYMTIKDFMQEEKSKDFNTINYGVQQPVNNNSNPAMDPSYSLRNLNQINNSNSNTNTYEPILENDSPYQEYDDYYDDVWYDYYGGYDGYDDHREDYFDEFGLED